MDTTLTTSVNSLTTKEAAFAGGLLGSMMVIGLIVLVLLIVAGWRIFEKAGEKGWKILIPIYDVYILFKICGLKNWFWGYLCISIVASIIMTVNTPVNEAYYITDTTGYTYIDYSLVDWSQHVGYIIGLVISCINSIATTIAVAIKLSRAFGKGVGYTLGLIFLPNIFTLILGFGKAKYSKKAADA